ncbi:hypothetical protein G4228_008832 [Cervus hanglu yarkandensis]|nr:hypothetical protein G4228_008832 [Cervus hanglu yarkandensis]
MADSQLFCVAEERSGHCAVVDGNFLYVWGGYVSIEDNEVYLPNDEIWTYDIDSGLWKSRYSGDGIMMFTYLTQRHRVGFNPKLKVAFHHSHEPRIHVQFLEIRAMSLADVFWIPINGENPKHRSWHTLTPIADDTLFLFGGLSADNIPLSDGWIHNVITNCWKQLTHLPKTKPRLWHTACLGKENEIMVFGGSKDDLLSLDTVRNFHI